MTWKQIKAEALRIVDEVAQRKADLELTEYQNKVRYRSDYPAGMTMRDHNAIVRETMREDFASWHILCAEARQITGHEVTILLVSLPLLSRYASLCECMCETNYFAQSTATIARVVPL
jgi:hypothetical protein